MTTTKTSDVDGTLAQIYALAGAGADVVRCTANDAAAVEALARIVPRSPVPLVADVHFQYRLALAALDAGVACLRLNPGNIRKPEQIRAVATEARDRGVPIRIGVNGGSLDPDIESRLGMTPAALVESAKRELGYFQDVGFDDVKISVKASDVPLMVESYRMLADEVDYPLHLGVTEAGPPPGGLVKATAGIATLLNEGIGDTIRYSLTADPVQEAEAGQQLLQSLGLRERSGTDLIACPSCGRAEVDVISVAHAAQSALRRTRPARASGGHGMRGERSGRGPQCRSGHRRRPGPRSSVRQGPGRVGGARGGDGRGTGSLGSDRRGRRHRGRARPC